MQKILEPRQVLLYNGQNDGSSVEVTFVKGEASSETCSGGRIGMTGPQAISVYIIKVVPPVGFDQQFLVTPAPPPRADNGNPDHKSRQPAAGRDRGCGPGRSIACIPQEIILHFLSAGRQERVFAAYRETPPRSQPPNTPAPDS